VTRSARQQLLPFGGCGSSRSRSHSRFGHARSGKSLRCNSRLTAVIKASFRYLIKEAELELVRSRHSYEDADAPAGGEDEDLDDDGWETNSETDEGERLTDDGYEDDVTYLRRTKQREDGSLSTEMDFA